MGTVETISNVPASERSGLRTNTPLIVGIGGTARAGSTSETALRACLDKAQAAGARTIAFTGRDLLFPLYDPDVKERTPQAQHLISSLRECDGIVIATPGYHGSLSGMIKNALDYAEDLRADARPYFDGRAVGVIACAYGWQATGSVLGSLRSIIHALRGWPTPLGVAINSSTRVFDEGGDCVDPVIKSQLELLAQQVVGFACQRAK